MALPPLKVKIGADTDGFDRAMGRAKKTVAGFAVAAGAAFVGVAAGIAAMTTKGLAAVDAQAKLARSIDGTVNGLRAVQLAGGDAGVSLGELNTAAQQLNRELARAAEGTGPAAEALGKLGLNAKELQRLDVDKRFALIADRAKDLGFSAGQTSDIMRDLGVRSRNMALLLTQGGDAIRGAREEVAAFGLELTETQTTAIEQANDAISRMRLIFEGLSQLLAANVAPVLRDVADRFNQFATSDQAREAVRRLADAFGRLAEIVLSGDFLNVAISGLERIANTAAFVADGMVTLADNVELVTFAFGAASIAVAALGGPLTLVAGLLAGALIGISSLRKAGENGAKGLSAAEQASVKLNEALGVFHDTASPQAAAQARDLARANLDIKKTALQAAKAELAKNEAIADSEFRVGNVGGGPDAVDVRLEQSQARKAALEDEIAALEALDETLSKAASVIQGGGGGPMDDPEDPEDPEDLPIIPGLAGAGGVADQMESRLEALLTGLQTEQEALDAWRESGLETLQDARERELITEEEFREAKERIEKEHQERMGKLQQQERRARMSGLKGVFSDLSSLMRTENDKLFKIGQAASIASATVSGFEAAVEAWNKGMKIGGPPAAAAFTAASLAKTGALISSIASQSPRGSGGGGSGGGGSVGGSGGDGGASAQPNIQTQRVDLNIIGGNDRDRLVAREVISVLNSAQRDGFRLDPRLIGV